MNQLQIPLFAYFHPNIASLCGRQASTDFSADKQIQVRYKEIRPPIVLLFFLRRVSQCHALFFWFE